MPCCSQGKSLDFQNATEASTAVNNVHKFFCGQDLQVFRTDLTEVGGKTPTDFNKTGLGQHSGNLTQSDLLFVTQLTDWFCCHLRLATNFILLLTDLKEKKRLTLASLKLNSISMPSTSSAFTAGVRLRLGLQGLQNNTETSLTSLLGDADRRRLWFKHVLRAQRSPPWCWWVEKHDGGHSHDG